MKRMTTRLLSRTALSALVFSLLLLGSGPAQRSAAAPASYEEWIGGGGGKNIVRWVNRVDGRLGVTGNVQLSRIPGPTVEPVNSAFAYASCTDCQTLVVAMQVNLVSRTATRVTPENRAVAMNVECIRCFTVARALQYTVQVEDPAQVPPEVLGQSHQIGG